MGKEPRGRFFFEKNHVGVLLLKSRGPADSAKLGCIFLALALRERERGIRKRKYHFLNY